MTTSLMAVSLDHHHRHGHGFKPLVRSHICKLGSFARLDSSANLDLDRSTAIPACTSASFTTEDASSSARFLRSYSNPCLSSKFADDGFAAAGPRIESIMGHCAPGIRSLVVEAAVALASDADPVATPNGLGSAYYLRSRFGDNIVVVKPIDEPLSMNDPKGIASWMLDRSGMRHPLRVSKTCVREVAAFLLDHDGFSGVPPPLSSRSHTTHSALPPLPSPPPRSPPSSASSPTTSTPATLALPASLSPLSTVSLSLMSSSSTSTTTLATSSSRSATTRRKRVGKGEKGARELGGRRSGGF